jgi:effector-binding domain-containing protein
MDYDINISKFEPNPTLSIRITTSFDVLPKEIGKAYRLIESYLSEIGHSGDIKKPFTAYHNEDMDNYDVEIGFILKQPLPGNSDIKSGMIPTGKKASAVYKGPYDNMQPTFDALKEWISENGYKWTGVVYEFYLNSSKEVPKSELLTEIAYELA